MKSTRREFLANVLKTGAFAGGMVPPLNAAPTGSSASSGPSTTLRSNATGRSQKNATIRIAVVQQAGNPGQVKENLTKALRFGEQALSGGADVVLFHEELLVGYVKNARELAETTNGPSVRAFQSLLKGSKALVLCGRTEREGDRYYIAATVIGADGIVANYRKTHLWWKARGLRYEPGVYTPGDRLVTFDVQGHKSGVMICYDGDFPEMTRSYANLGCRILFWMNNRGSRGYAEVKRLAEANSMIMATSCCCGPDESGNLCRGGSNITNARGKLVSEIWDKEGVIYADVQPEEATRLRTENPAARGQRGDLYHYLKEGPENSTAIPGNEWK